MTHCRGAKTPPNPSQRFSATRPLASLRMSPPRSLVVIVTGASSGIGRAVAARFAADGARVALAARSEAGLRETADLVAKAGGEALVVPTDVADWRSVQAMAESVRARWGYAGVVVSNAGVGRSGTVDEMPVEDWAEQISTNLTGAFHVAKAVIPLVRAAPKDRPRAIVHVASVSGLDGMAGLSAYCASKFGLRGFSLSLASELAAEGIRVTAVNPGYVATPMAQGAPARMGDMIQPADLAEQVWWLVHAPPSVFTDELTVWPFRLYTT